MEIGKILSLKKRIEQEYNLEDVVAELISDWKNIPPNVFDALLNRLRNDDNPSFISEQKLGELLILSRAARFFHLLRDKKMIPSNPEVLIKILKSGLSAWEFERNLVDRIDQDLNSETAVSAEPKLEALRDHGSIDCLSDLQRIEYEYNEKFQTAKIKAGLPRNAEDIEGAIEGKLAEFDVVAGRALKDAIDSIKTRSELINDSWLMNVEDATKSMIDRVQGHQVPESEQSTVSAEDVSSIVGSSESETVEFKSSLRWDYRQEKNNPDVTYACLKTICAFLNSKGGTLIIGISDDKRALGIEKDKLSNDDKFIRFLFDKVETSMGTDVGANIRAEIVGFKSKSVCLVNCSRSKQPVYLKTKRTDEKFFIRTGSATKSLKPSELERYLSSDQFEKI